MSAPVPPIENLIAYILNRRAELNLTHVVDPFLRAPVTQGLTYLRLHGIGGARHVYTDEQLAALARMVPPDDICYVMFNNLPRVGDARRFRLSASRR